MHQYLDSDGSGTNATCVSSTIGAERIADATAWLQSTGFKGFLGETAGGSNGGFGGCVNRNIYWYISPLKPNALLQSMVSFVQCSNLVCGLAPFGGPLVLGCVVKRSSKGSNSNYSFVQWANYIFSIERLCYFIFFTLRVYITYVTVQRPAGSLSLKSFHKHSSRSCKVRFPNLQCRIRTHKYLSALDLHSFTRPHGSCIWTCLNTQDFENSWISSADMQPSCCFN